jgi:hypothetical protein
MLQPRYLITVTVVLTFLFCELPQNPRNPESAGIELETLTRLPGESAVNTVFACTVSVLYPEFVDSFALFQSVNDASPVKVSGTPVGDDSIIVLSIEVPFPGTYTFSFLLYKTIGTDSVEASVTVFATTPSVTAPVTSQNVPIGDSASFSFSVADPDSNLLEYAYSGGVFNDKKYPFLASERADATIICSISADQVKSLHDTIMVFSITAADEKGQVSPAVLCTLLVTDTVAPDIGTVEPLGDSLYSVAVLPDTIRLTVQDMWRVDSVKYGGGRVLFSLGDTVVVPLGSLDSGITRDSLEAWDPAGNRAVKTIKIHYAGAKVYAPKITPFFQTINEREQFDTVFLDQKVTITDTAATYGKDSLHWSVAIDTADNDMVVHYDSLRRALMVEAPQGEIFHNRIAVLSATVTDPSGVSSMLHGITFLMVEKNDGPVITCRGQKKIFNSVFDTLILDSCGYDPENNARLYWTIERGTYFYPDSLHTIVCPSQKGTGRDPLDPIIVGCFLNFTGKVRIAPDTTLTKAFPLTQDTLVDTLRFTVKSVTGGDTAQTSLDIPYIWYRLKFIPLDTGMIIIPKL